MRPRLGIYPTPQALNPYGRFDSRRKTLAFIDELSKELLYIKPRLNRQNKLFEYDAYEYDKGIYVIDVKNIKGHVKGSGDNLLTSYYWSLLFSILRSYGFCDNMSMSRVVDCYKFATDINIDVIKMVYGTGTTAESFIDYTLISQTGEITPSVAIGYLSDRTRITVSGTIPSDSSELGLYQRLDTAGSGNQNFLFARKIGSWRANQAIAWYNDYLSPWVRGIGDFMYGFYRNANITMVRIDGVSFTARTSNPGTPGTAYLVASSDLVSWSPTLIAISNAFSLNNYYVDVSNTRYLRATFFHGLYSPANNIQGNTIGLYLPVYDSLGNIQIVCVMVQPLSSPVTLYAGRNNLIVLRIVAM